MNDRKEVQVQYNYVLGQVVIPGANSECLGTRTGGITGDSTRL